MSMPISNTAVLMFYCNKSETIFVISIGGVLYTVFYMQTSVSAPTVGDQRLQVLKKGIYF